MKKHKYLFTYKIVYINVLSIVLFGIMAIISYFLIKNDLLSINLNIEGLGFFIFIISAFLYMVIHEFIHGAFYILNGAKSENIHYGIALEKGVFYTRCGEYVTKKNIMMSVIAPFLILGVLTGVLSIILDLPYLYALSFLNIAGCSGDLMMFIFFLGRDKDIRFKEIDDSMTFILETKEDLSNKKFIGVKLIKELDEEVESKNNRKFMITKESKPILIFLVILILAVLILNIVINKLL